MTSITHPYEDGLEQRPANYTALSPLSFLKRSASVFPEKIAIIHGELRYSYAEFYARCRRLASALAARSAGLTTG